jgi:elongation of very long chain fatty acids protein 6
MSHNGTNHTFIERNYHWTISYLEDGYIDYSQLLPLSHPEFLPFEFEKSMDFMELARFFHRNWSLPFIVSAVYMMAAFGGQRYMRNRPAFQLKWPLVVWNMSIGIFSMLGFWRCYPVLKYILSQPNGFYESICIP